MVVVATRPCQSLSLHAKPCVLQLIGNCSLILNRSAYHPHLDGLTARLAASWLCVLEVAIPIHQDVSCRIPLERFANNHAAKSVVRLFFSFLFLKVQYNIRFTILITVSVWLNGIKQW